MRKLLWLTAACCALTAGLRADEPFSRRMSAEEFKAAGLAKLSPEELAQLDALFGKYGVGNAAVATTTPPAIAASAGLATPSESANPRAAAARAAEIDAATGPGQARVKEIEMAAAARVAEAEARARKAEQEVALARAAADTAKAEQKKSEESFLTRAKKVFVAPGTKVEVAALETEIDGAFTGWDEGTVWRMKDGSIWRVDNKPQPLQAKRVLNPKVRIYPATMSGYWLEFMDLDYKLRVRQLK